MSRMSGWIDRLVGGLAPGEYEPVDEISGEDWWAAPSFRMAMCGGRDQVARAARTKGWQGYECPVPWYFAREVMNANGGLILDVGANTGFYALLALAVCGTVRVAAYEPMTAVRRILKKNFQLNSAGRRVAIHADAVSDTSGKRRLYLPNVRHGLIETSASLSATFKAGSGDAYAVSATTLDRRHFGKLRVAIIKVDAESHDFQVLRGARQILLRHRPVIFLEVLLGADETGLTALLRDCAYVDCALQPNGATEFSDIVKHDTLAWNHMWVPREDAQRIRNVL